VRLFPASRIAAAYGAEAAIESYRCRYGLNPKFRAELLAGPLRASADDETGEVRAVELDGHPFFSNEARLIDQVDTHLNRVVDLGFVRRLRGQDGMFEVQRILKAFVDAQWLGEFDARLATYRAQLHGKAEPPDEE
jgi:hypothetical protein